MIAINWGLKQSAEMAANKLLEELNLLDKELINVHYILDVIKINNKHLKTYCGYLAGQRGYTFHKDGNFMVCYDPDSYHLHNVRFTIAHEIGHICCSHFKECNIDSRAIYGRCEYEANYFGAALLMPEYLMQQCNTLDLIEISIRLKVSEESIGYRINTLQELYKNRGVHIGFCTTCGKLIYGKGARFCAHCGVRISA